MDQRAAGMRGGFGTAVFGASTSAAAALGEGPAIRGRGAPFTRARSLHLHGSHCGVTSGSRLGRSTAAVDSGSAARRGTSMDRHAGAKMCGGIRIQCLKERRIRRRSGSGVRLVVSGIAPRRTDREFGVTRPGRTGPRPSHRAVKPAIPENVGNRRTNGTRAGSGPTTGCRPWIHARGQFTPPGRGNPDPEIPSQRVEAAPRPRAVRGSARERGARRPARRRFPRNRRRRRGNP